MKISILGSGSEGNSIYIEHEGKGLLVDAGFSAKNICERLEEVGASPKSIEAILITHEHSDHIRGAGAFSRKYGMPIYITKESLEAGMPLLGKIDRIDARLIIGEFTVAERFAVTPFDVSHDAYRTLGFRVSTESGKSLAISTDIGKVDEEVLPFLSNVDVLVIESNYDIEMLKKCAYPYVLKSRIDSDKGHLSNVRSAETIAECYSNRLKKVYLAHVSRNSNTYEMAGLTTKLMLDSKGIGVKLEVALQNRPTDMYSF